MTNRWLILADDLTGAADCAIPFAKRGIRSIVVSGENARDIDEQYSVVSVDAGTRGLMSAQAAQRHRDLLRARWRLGRRFYKKIDSTLRGHPAEEVAAVIHEMHLRGDAVFGICAPAFPANGRTTEGGRVYVHGAPLEHTELWRRDHRYATGDVVDILASAGLRAERVPLDIIRLGELQSTLADIAARGSVAVCDAVLQEHLDRIARAALEMSRDVLFIGSAGIAHVLAAREPIIAREPQRIDRRAGGSLFVVGSVARASREAALRMAKDLDVHHVSIDVRLLRDESPPDLIRAADEVIRAIRKGEDVLVEILVHEDTDLSQGRVFADRLVQHLQPAAALVSGIFATGGDTAAAVLTAFGVKRIELIGEIESGVCLGLTLGAISCPVVTKAGAFGDDGTLIRVARRLRSIRETGSLE